MQAASHSLATRERAFVGLNAAAPGNTRARWATALGVGLAVTLLQTLLVSILAGGPSLADGYRALSQWDSVWYARLAEHGYPDTVPVRQEEMAHVGFFPGYPLFGWLVATLFRLTFHDAILVAAQLACWGFWTYVILFLQRWRVSPAVAVVAAVAVAVHPAAFYLVTGYSESLFLAAVLGFLYWSSVPGRLGWGLAALHGVILTATRIVGLPLVIVPLLIAVASWRTNKNGGWRRGLAAALLGGVASLGGLLFFAYCQWHLGRWDVYMYSQKAGWGVEPNYLAILTLDIYRIAWPTFHNGLIIPNYLSRVCVPFTVLLFCVLAWLEVRLARQDPERSWRQRLGFYLCGGLMFYIAVSGLANSELVSMIRYTFCVHVMLTLAVAHLAVKFPLPHRQSKAIALAVLSVAAVLSLTCEMMCAYLFTHSEWVA
jgi:hypothetical protein